MCICEKQFEGIQLDTETTAVYVICVFNTIGPKLCYY